MRGYDFGSWASTPEPVPLVCLHRSDDGAKQLTADERMLVLPLVGEVDEGTLGTLRAILREETRKYLPCRMLQIASDGRLAAYVEEENLLHMDGRFNEEEVARLGRYMGASHVLAARLCDARFYPPQNLEIALVMVETVSGEPIVEMKAGFSASEQSVVAALGRHLDQRQARRYDRISLDFMLRSPTEYGRFALAECCRALSKELWEETDLRNSAAVPTYHMGIIAAETLSNGL